MYDVAFSIETELTTEELILPENAHLLVEALQKRVDYLKANPWETADAFGHCDTYEVFEVVKT
jgi:hypothetical protein